MSSGLSVRDMTLADVGIRIEYFHGASDGHLRTLGVDRSLLPDRQAWRAFYEEDHARPLHQRANFSLVWELDGQPVGFSSTDRIIFGQEAFMHLHIVDASLRQGGFGVEYVKMSTRVYFKKLSCSDCSASPTRSTQRQTAPCSERASSTCSHMRRPPVRLTSPRSPTDGCSKTRAGNTQAESDQTRTPRRKVSVKSEETVCQHGWE